MLERYQKDEIKLLNESLEELEFNSILKQISGYCHSSAGQEYVLNSKPTDDIYWLRNEHKLIEENVQLIIENEFPPISGYEDIRTFLRKSLVENAVLKSDELLSIAETIRVGRLLKSFFSDRKEECPNLWEETERIYDNRLLEKHINEAIDENAAIKDNASRELAQIRRNILRKSAQMRKRMDAILKKVSKEEMAQEDFVTLREGRFVLPVISSHKKHIPGIIHGVSQTGSTVFLEPSEITEMNNELSLLLNEEKREIYRILSNLTSELGEESRDFLKSIEIIAHLDSCLAKAKYAVDYGGVPPKILDDNFIYCSNIRHPILVRSKGIKKVAPLSVEFDEKRRGYLISGPNAGGKTVAIKNVGISIAMALSGVFPLGECKTGFRMIYASIDDRQSIEQDLSAFSSQILRINEILACADDKSLILIDEIGSGTDPYEGGALSAGILDSLLEVKSFFAATTHNSALKSFAFSKNEISNASLEFDDEKLVPTYKFLDQIPGNSYAFQLAENLGLPKRVLDRAKSYLGDKGSQLEDSLAMLQKLKNKTRRLEKEAEEAKREALKQKEKFQKKYEELKNKRARYIEEAKEKAGEIIKDANALIENTIREVKEREKPVGEVKKQYEETKKNIEKELEKPKREPEVESGSPQIGDYVVISDSNAKGQLVDLDEKTTQAEVDVNGMKFKTPLNKLKKTKKEKKKSVSKSKADYISFDAKSKLDIRGQRAEEAAQEIDRFLAEAIAANLLTVTIVHGKGTGVLRNVTKEYLTSRDEVKSFRSGKLSEGGDGITVVELG